MEGLTKTLHGVGKALVPYGCVRITAAFRYLFYVSLHNALVLQAELL